MFPLVIFGVFGAYAMWTMSRRKAAMSNLAPAYRRFFEQTGYRHVELGSAPLDDHARMSEQKMRDLMAGKGHEVHLVRDFHGLPVRHDSTLGGEYRGLQQVTTMTCAWTASLGRAPAVVLQVADRKLSGAGKVVREMMTNTSRSWTPIYPTRIETGDAELDKRFVVYGVDPAAVRRVVAQARDMLLACTEVDLAVRPDGELRFSDPFQHNIQAGMGGTLGTMAMGSDPVKMLEVTVPVHERITHLLATVARACA
jgi:hypothetical protein